MDLADLTSALGSGLNIETKGTLLSFARQNNKWNKAEDVTEVVKQIKECENLEGLELEGNTLGIEAAEAIGKALSSHPEFKFALWKDLFTGRLKTEIPQALKHLFAGLIKAEAKLKKLDLSDNALGPIGVEGMIDFMKSPVCYSLQELRLNNNGLGIKGGTMLANSMLNLVENAKSAGTPLQLKVFISGRNRLEKEGATIFSKLFASVGTLEEIAMPQNGIFHQGIAALAEAFSKNPNLRIINLNDNTFTPKGAHSMAKYLPTMQNLEVINFGDCLVKTKGAIYLAESLADQHTKLREVHLDSNEITLEGGLMLLDAMANKPSLELLKMDTNQFGESGIDDLTAKLEEIEKFDVCEFTEDNEEPDSDEEDEDTVEEDSDNDDSYEDIDEEEVYEVIPPTDPSKTEKPTKMFKVTASQFLDSPTADNMRVFDIYDSYKIAEEAERRSQQIAEEDLDSPPELHHLNELFKALMKVLQFGNSPDARVKKDVESVVQYLAEKTFEQGLAVDKNLVINSFLVHLGAIKSENKKFKIDWDIRNCLTSVPLFISQPYVPRECLRSLQMVLSSRLVNKLSGAQAECDTLLATVTKLLTSA